MTRRSTALRLLILGAVALGSPVDAQWVRFADETAGRNTIAPERFETDPDEKDYAFGDVDRDGDVDLVVVRKQRVTTAGKRPNYLFLNDGGILVDATDQHARASDVPGDQGFRTPTNDRDVTLVDVDLDGWLDIVTSVAISDGDPKHVGYPRVYRNLGCRGACRGTADWLGFRFENDRIPVMQSWDGRSDFNPRFTAVDAGDVNGDGYPDLWFSDHDSSGEGGPPEPAGADFNDRLLINLGSDPGPPGYFTDASLGPGSAFTGMIFLPGVGDYPFLVSAFGAVGKIGDFNGDGLPDIVKQSALLNPLYVGIAYNDPAEPGTFNSYEVVYQVNGYYVSTGELNNDDRLDLIITDNGFDRYLLNQGPAADGKADFDAHTYSFLHTGGGSAPSTDDGLGGESIVSDLNDDGWNDVLIADVDVDLNSCGRRLHIYRNAGGDAGGFVEMREETTGTGCNGFSHPASCLVAGIPADRLKGTFNVAPFDLNGDGWKDLVVGRCTGTEIWIAEPPTAVAGSILDDHGEPAQALRLGKAGAALTLSWGGSCLAGDSDYAVYRGTFDADASGAGSFDNHARVTCSTGGTSELLVPEDGERAAYFLVVPHNETTEGSYGTDATGTERGRGTGGACYPQVVGGCS